MRKNLGVIIGKRDHHEGTIYYTEICDYLVLEENGKIVVEGKTDPKKLKELDFVPENDDSFLLGYYANEEEAFKAITEFEKTQWGQIKKELGGNNMKNKMEKELIKAKKKAIELDRQLKKEQQEEPVNLCPECSFFCEQRFIDGICK